jgi:hypothetical protein
MRLEIDNSNLALQKLRKLWLGEKPHETYSTFPSGKEITQFITEYLELLPQALIAVPPEQEQVAMHRMFLVSSMMRADLYQTIANSAMEFVNPTHSDSGNTSGIPLQVVLDYLWHKAQSMPTPPHEEVEKFVKNLPFTVTRGSVRDSINHYQKQIKSFLKKTQLLWLYTSDTDTEKGKKLISWIEARLPSDIQKFLKDQLRNKETKLIMRSLPLFCGELFMAYDLYFKAHPQVNVLGGSGEKHKGTERDKSKDHNQGTSSGQSDKPKENTDIPKKDKGLEHWPLIAIPFRRISREGLAILQKEFSGDKLDSAMNLRKILLDQRTLEREALSQKLPRPIPIKGCDPKEYMKLDAKLRARWEELGNTHPQVGYMRREGQHASMVGTGPQGSLNTLLKVDLEYRDNIDRALIDGKYDIECRLDSQCKPYDIISLACYTRSLTHTPLEPLDVPITIHPVGPPIICTHFIKVNVSLTNVEGYTLMFDITPLVLPWEKDVCLWIGASTLASTQLFSISDSLSRLGTNSGEGKPGRLHYLEAKPISVIEENIESMVARARSNWDNLSIGIRGQADFSRFEDLVEKFAGIFRIGLNGAPPARVPPLHLTLKNPYQRPIKARPRKNMPLDKSMFIEDLVDNLLKYDLAYTNPTSKYSSSTMAVLKSSGKLRMVIDYVRINDILERYDWPLPRVDECGARLAGSEVFFLVDLDNAYFQFPLAEDSQEWLTFLTAHRAISPKVVPQGIHNAPAYVQATMESIFNDFRRMFEIYLDDIANGSKSAEASLDCIEILFSTLQQYGLFINPEKCNFFCTVMEWLGRVLSTEGLSFSKEQLAPILDLHIPQTASDLQKFVCGAQWFSQVIPNFATCVQPLRKLLLECTRKVKSARKGKLARVDIRQLWSEEHDAAFTATKEALSQALIISFLQPGGTVCLFTDSSSTGWGVMLTQVMNWNHSKSIHEQDHLILGVASGIYAGAMETNEDIVVKESFSIHMAIEKFYHILGRSEGFTLFCDHNNLQQLLDIDHKKSAIHKNTRARLARYAVQLSSLRFTYSAISGDDNLWADILSRWGANHGVISITDIPRMSELQVEEAEHLAYLHAIQARRHLAPETTQAYRMFHNLNYSVTHPEFTWPSLEFIQEQYDLSTLPIPANLTIQETGIYLTTDKQIWIPDDARRLQLCICIVAHCSGAGHSRLEVTLNAIRTQFYWSDLKRVVTTFCVTCHQCQLFNTKKMVKRPFGETLKATRPNEILQFDYLYISPKEYVLVLMDKFSAFTYLTFSDSPDAQHITTTMLDWIAFFGIPESWLSDGGSHFVNTIMQSVCSHLMIEHHVTTAYCPWSNGGVERVNRSLLSVLRKILDENAVPHSEWKQFLPVINKLLNENKSAPRGYAPREIFTGLEASTNLSMVYDDVTDNKTHLASISEDIKQVMEELRTRLKVIHDVVNHAMEISISRNKENRLKDRGTVIEAFYPGDFVLVGTTVTHLPSKLQATFTGPYRIVESINPYVFLCEDLLIRDTTVKAHVSRMMHYSGQVDPDSEETLRQIAYGKGTTTYDFFKKLSKDRKTLMLDVHWLGFAKEEDTAETLLSCWEHNPTMVVAYVESLPQDHRLRHEALDYLSILEKRG